MTNGDVIKDLFNPRDDQIKVLSGEWVEIEIQRKGINFSCDLKWWNAPCQTKEKESATVAAISKQQESCTEIKTMTKEQDYMRGYKDGKSDALDEVRAEIEQIAYPSTTIYKIFEIIDKHKGDSKESATVAKFHDFYPEDSVTWPPADKELLVKNHIGDNFIAYLGYDNSEDGGWGFYSKDGDFIADLDEIDAWMQISQHERDRNYIPIQERRAKDLNIDDPGPEEEKDR